MITLTCRHDGLAYCVRTPVTVMGAFSDSASLECDGIWDTGANVSAITRDAAAALGLKSVRKVEVHGVHGSSTVNVYVVRVRLSEDAAPLTTVVTECGSLSDDGKVGLLIGMSIITTGDFCVTNHEGKTVMTFRSPSLETVDYTAELREYDKIRKTHEARARHGDERCPCGSGRKYANCHGKSKYAPRGGSE